MRYSSEHPRRRICGSAALPGVFRQLQGSGYPAHDIQHLLQLLTLQQVPPLEQQGYRSLCQVLNLAPPQLFFARTAFNMYAFYSEGIIVVGVDEIAALVVDMWHQSDAALHEEVIASFQRSWGRYPTPQERFEHFRHLVTVLVMAHELGHAGHAVGVPSRFAHQEAGADYVAGYAAYYLGLPKALGELLFYDLGCVGSACTHPPPGQRRTAFDTGFDEAWAQNEARVRDEARARDETVRMALALQASRSNDGVLAALGVFALFAVGGIIVANSR